MDELEIHDEALFTIAKITSMFLIVREAPHKIAKGTLSKKESVYFGVNGNYGIICMQDDTPHFIYLDSNRVRYLRMEGFSDEFIDNEATGVWKEVSSVNEFVEKLINL